MDTLPRTPEPELMDDVDQARAYAGADFSVTDQAFVDHVTARFPELPAPAGTGPTGTGPMGASGTVLDVGCGPAEVSIRLARACPGWSVLGVDGAGAMLDLARARVRGEGLADRIRFEQIRLPSEDLASRRFDALISNSVLHHFADPAVLWDLAARVLPAGAPIAVMDLVRPADPGELARKFADFPTDAPAVLRTDFLHSLQAAYRVDEVVAQLDGAGLGHLTVEQPTERHLLVMGRR